MIHSMIRREWKEIVGCKTRKNQKQIIKLLLLFRLSLKLSEASEDRNESIFLIYDVNWMPIVQPEEHHSFLWVGDNRFDVFQMRQR